MSNLKINDSVKFIKDPLLNPNINVLNFIKKPRVIEIVNDMVCIDCAVKRERGISMWVHRDFIVN